MLNNAEINLYSTIGQFSTVAQPLTGSRLRDNPIPNYTSEEEGVLAGQCAGFLYSKKEFNWFIEEYQVDGLTGILSNKKLYPAKVEGLGISVPGQNSYTFKWREGLIYNGFSALSMTNPSNWGFRPGFGQTILVDLQRPIESVTIDRTNLNLTNPETVFKSFGRLMSAAAIVDPILGAAYNASQSQKKKKSLNSQDYEQIPTYPPYDIYINTGGY